MSLESASQYHDYLFSGASLNATETRDVARQKTGTGAETLPSRHRPLTMGSESCKQSPSQIDSVL
jgi:hypothetical protein